MTACVRPRNDRRNWRGRRLPLVNSGLLHDRQDLGLGDEALPALLVPVEDDPDAVLLGGIANTSAPSDPCSALLAPAVEKTFSKRSRSSICVVTRSIVLSIR